MYLTKILLMPYFTIFTKKNRMLEKLLRREKIASLKYQKYEIYYL